MKIATGVVFMNGAMAAVGWGAARAVLPGCGGRAFALDGGPLAYEVFDLQRES
jgi:hypothetical protein